MFLGDLVINGPAPFECFQEIRNLNPICWVKGNTDVWYQEINEGWSPSTEQEEKLFRKYRYAQEYLTNEIFEYLVNLPMKCSLEIEGVSILGVHGSPRSFTEAILKDTTQELLEDIFSNIGESIIFSGHSHIPIRKYLRNKIIFNVGSVGMPFDGDIRAAYVIVKIENSVPEFIIRRVKYPLDEIIQLAESQGFPDLDEYRNLLLKAKIPK